MKTSIIIPMYQESAIIESTLDALLSYLDGRFGGEYELLLVDDGSRDGTKDLAAALVAERAKATPDGACADGRVLVLGYGENRGKGAAVRFGMLRARGDVRIFTDADLAYGCEVLGEVSARLETGKGKRPDIVIGSRDIHEDGYCGYSRLRRLVSRTYRAILRGFFSLSVTDSQCGIKGFTAAAAERIFSEARTDRYAFDFEIITLAERAGLQIAELPVCVVNNRKGRIRLFRDSFRMLRDVLATRKRLRGKSSF